MESKIQRLRLILTIGSIVFGLSAVALIAVPTTFNQLLGLTSDPALEWSMRMTGITLVALAGNMFSHASRGSERSVLFTAKVMAVSAFLLGVLTLLVPGNHNWFTIAYSVVGFAFSAAYTLTLIQQPKSR
jgi:O-antigen/teichoic acid export membrane protein